MVMENHLSREIAKCGRIFPPQIAKLSALAFNAARFIPGVVRDELDRRGQWPDVINSIYALVIEFWRERGGERFDPRRKSDYKLFVRFVWNNLYRVLREHLPSYKQSRKMFYVRPDKIRNVDSDRKHSKAGLPFVCERDLVPEEEEA